LFERSYGCICYVLVIIVSVDELDIYSFDGFEKSVAHCIRSQRVQNRSDSVVTYVNWRCQVTKRHCGSGSRCVTISLMILNWTIRRYRITDCVVTYLLKYLMSFEKC
jgi:hypothetical protein